VYDGSCSELRPAFRTAQQIPRREARTLGKDQRTASTGSSPSEGSPHADDRYHSGVTRLPHDLFARRPGLRRTHQHRVDRSPAHLHAGLGRVRGRARSHLGNAEVTMRQSSRAASRRDPPQAHAAVHARLAQTDRAGLRRHRMREQLRERRGRGGPPLARHAGSRPRARPSGVRVHAAAALGRRRARYRLPYNSTNHYLAGDLIEVLHRTHHADPKSVTDSASRAWERTPGPQITASDFALRQIRTPARGRRRSLERRVSAQRVHGQGEGELRPATLLAVYPDGASM